MIRGGEMRAGAECCAKIRYRRSNKSDNLRREDGREREPDSQGENERQSGEGRSTKLMNKSRIAA
jgi:hypothetical protein